MRPASSHKKAAPVPERQMSRRGAVHTAHFLWVFTECNFNNLIHGRHSSHAYATYQKKKLILAAQSLRARSK